jgi:hypothetical protein
VKTRKREKDLAARQLRLVNRFGRFDYMLSESTLTEVWSDLRGSQSRKYEIAKVAYYKDDRKSGEAAWRNWSFGAFIVGVAFSIILSGLGRKVDRIGYIVMLIMLAIAAACFFMQYKKDRYIDFYDKKDNWLFTIKKDPRNSQLENIINLIVKNKKKK